MSCVLSAFPDSVRIKTTSARIAARPECGDLPILPGERGLLQPRSSHSTNAEATISPARGQEFLGGSSMPSDRVIEMATPGQILRHQCDVAKIQAGHDDGKRGCQGFNLRCPGCPWKEAWTENIVKREFQKALIGGTSPHPCPTCGSQMNLKRMKWSCKCGYKEA